MHEFVNDMRMAMVCCVKGAHMIVDDVADSNECFAHSNRHCHRHDTTLLYAIAMRNVHFCG